MAGGSSKVNRAAKPLPSPRSEVVRLAEKREVLKRDLEQLEQQISDFEGSYLKTSPYGNAIKGWRATTASAGDAGSSITSKDLIFSSSSVSWTKKLKLDPAATAAAETAATPRKGSAGQGGAAAAAAAAPAEKPPQEAVRERTPRKASAAAAATPPPPSSSKRGKARAAAADAAAAAAVAELDFEEDSDGPPARRNTRSHRS